jgi:HAD superfamily hydrolase (TIGR01484 family)
MDGTLLNNEQQISNENKKAIHNVIEQGIAVVLACGRPLESIYPYTLELGIDLPIISTNGAFIKNPSTNKVIYSEALQFDYAKEIIQYGKENGYKVSLYTDQGVSSLAKKC